MENPKKESLIIFKGQPGTIVETGKKIDIKLADGENKKVRDKDFITIHPGPVKSLKIPELYCDVPEIWTLLQGETISLMELADFLYGEDSPTATYNAYRHLEKGLYFSGELDQIQCTTPEFVEQQLEKERVKAKKEAQFSESITRLSNGEWTAQDESALREIEGVALEQRSGSKILKSIGIKESVIDAHRYLLRIGYWALNYNPHPGRMSVSLKSTVKRDDYETTTNSEDLTYLKSYAIDDEGSKDPDDAVSLEGSDKLWIHITDVASIIKAGTFGDLDASAKGSNLYLPTETVHMLPKEVTDIQALGNENGNNTLSFMVQFDEEFNIIKREIHLARVNVKRYTYAGVEAERDSDEFKPFYDIAIKLKNRREEAGAISISLPEVRIRVDETGDIDIKPINGVDSRNVVSEFMLLAGETAALFCNENSIAIPYASQLPPDSKGKPEEDLASMFVWRRKFKRGETRYSPEPHSGLGLSCYARATSPLRRYTDLVVNQQIRSFLLGEPTLPEEDILMKVSPAIESIKRMAICERASNLHWKLVYISQNREKIYEGTYVEKKDKNGGTFLIEDLALEVIVPMAELPELNSKTDLKLKKVDIPAGLVTFTPC